MDKIRKVEDKISKVEEQIETVSQAIYKIYNLKTPSASLDTVEEEKLEYLRKKEEDLRKEKFLLLEILKNESESRLIYSLQINYHRDTDRLIKFLLSS